jgi:hypothetical protein
MRYRVLAVLLLTGAALGNVFAQNAQTLADGKSFAESLVPQSASQIVNPTGVNPSAWSAGSTTVPTSMPTGLGTFSSPLTNSPLYNLYGSQGALSGLGNARIQACKTYVPTGDPIADQECAAVKFMNKDCIPLNNSQLQILGSAGATAGTGAGCTDTYGAGQSNFGFQNAITPSDPIFHLSQIAQNNASSSTTQQCESTPVVTKPAQYETNQCAKTISTDSHTCTQELAVAVTTSYTPARITYSCNGGVLQGSYCVSTSGSPATASYSCPNGGTLSGTNCLAQTSTPATPYYTCSSGELHGQSCITSSPAIGVSTCPPPEMAYTPPDIWTMTYDNNNVGWCWHWATDRDDPFGSVAFRAATSYQCPNGGTLSGNTCSSTSTATLNYRCDNGTLSGTSCMTGTDGPATVTYTCASGTLSGSQCVTSTSTPANTDYSCPGGAAPVGTQCITYSTQVHWIDNCTPYEQSAGVKLGDPK